MDRAAVANPPAGWPRIVAHLVYDDVAGAVAWLTETFGFAERTGARHTDLDGRIGRTQLDVVDSIITVGTPGIHGVSPRTGVSSMLYVYVDEVDAHYQHALAAGAHLILPLETVPWGDRRYQAVDLEGHQWTFAQHVSDDVHDHD